MQPPSVNDVGAGSGPLDVAMSSAVVTPPVPGPSTGPGDLGDLGDTPHGAGGAPPTLALPGRRPPWRWVAAAGLVLAVGGLAAYAVDARRSADHWRGLAGTWEDRAAAADERRDELVRRLESSEAGTAELEWRLSELAAQKTALDGERQALAAERDGVARASAAATDARTQLSNCLFEQHTFYGELLATDDATDWSFVESVAERTEAVCGRAYGAVDALAAALAEPPT